MRKFLIGVACSFSIVLAGCQQTINNIQQGTTALIAFNNALIQVNVTILNNLQAQAKQLAPLQCGAISLGATLAADPVIGAKVNTYFASHQNGAIAVAVASDLCSIAGLPPIVTSVPRANIAPVGTPVPAAP